MNSFRSKFLVVAICALLLVIAGGWYIFANYRIVDGIFIKNSEYKFLGYEDNLLIAYDNADVDAQIAEAEKLKANGSDWVTANIYLAEAYINKGSLRFQEDEYADKAIVLLQEVLNTQPKNIQALIAMGYAYEIKQEYLNAFTYYDRAIEVDPMYDAAYTKRGHAYDLTGDWNKAQADYLKAYEINPDNANTLLNLARLYYRTGGNSNTDLATQFADLVIDKSENSYAIAVASELIGLVAVDTDDFQLAIQYFDFAIENDPMYPGPYEHRAYAKMLLAEDKDTNTKERLYTEAGADIEKALSLHTGSSNATALKGLLTFARGQKAEALALYNKALSMVGSDITLGLNEKTVVRDDINNLIALLNS